MYQTSDTRPSPERRAAYEQPAGRAHIEHPSYHSSSSTIPRRHVTEQPLPRQPTSAAAIPRHPILPHPENYTTAPAPASASAARTSHSGVDTGQMALQTLSRHHHAFPEQHSTYYPAAYAPPPQQQQHLASSYQIHTREPLYRDPLYHQTFSPNQGVYYQAPASSHFTPTTTAHSYQPPTYPSTALPMQTPLAHQPLTSYSPPLPTSLSTIDTTPRPRTDLSPVESLQGSRYHKNKRSQDKHGRSGSKTATTPGPIKATGPLVVWEDHNGVRYITFQYSINRETQNIRIRCDIDSVDLDSLSYDFKLEMSVYPRAFEEKDYNSKRAPYERECNQIAWALVKLNDCLAGNRGLRQRAVDSWRNSSHDEKKRSRRVRRTIKETYRREKQASLEESLESSPLLDFEPHPSSYPSSGHSAGMMMMPTHMHTPPLSTSDPLEYARYPI